MIRYLTLGEVVDLHRRLLAASGGAAGIRDLGALDSSVAQPKATYGGVDLYPTMVEKAAAMETFLVLNGSEIDAGVEDQECLMLDLAAGRIDRPHLTNWLRQHLKPLA